MQSHSSLDAANQALLAWNETRTIHPEHTNYYITDTVEQINQLKLDTRLTQEMKEREAVTLMAGSKT